ncbi:MAG TPA: hypothetical protein VGI06_16275 [Acidimicrobiales bacterium]
MGAPDRTARTAALAAGGRVGPWWVERQRDPRSPAFVALGEPALLGNVTGRDWTGIGTVAASRRALVDPAGSITPWPGGWSLDWWVGAGDRWYLPSREVTVRQGLIEGAPVVETRLRVPGGDVASAAYVAVGPAELGDVAVMEVTNRSAVPVAVAFVVRPCNPDGAAWIEHIGLDDGVVVIDGRVGLVLPRAPAGTAWASAAAGDVLQSVRDNHTAPSRCRVRCRDGLAEAAFVFPVPHTATIRAVMPLEPRRRRRGTPLPPVPLPDSSSVARGWAVHARRWARFTLPPGRVADAFAANRHYVVLAAGCEELSPGPGSRRPFDFPLAVLVVDALDRCGMQDIASALLLTYPDRQRRDGTFGGDVVSTAAAIAALDQHWRLTRDSEVLAATLPSVARAVDVLAGPRSAGAVDGAQAAARLLRAGGLHDVVARAEASIAATSKPTTGPHHGAPPGQEWPCLGPDGVDLRGTVARAIAEVAAADARSPERMGWLLDVATPTFTWPAVRHPWAGGGSAGDGHDGAVAAQFTSFVAQTLVGGDESGEVRLCPVWPVEWRGESLEVHDVPTASGLLSFAVRWHGAHPALLWDLTTHAGVHEVRITAPGLDPTWSTVEPAGDALLDAAAVAAGDGE